MRALLDLQNAYYSSDRRGTPQRASFQFVSLKKSSWSDSTPSEVSKQGLQVWYELPRHATHSGVAGSAQATMHSASAAAHSPRGQAWQLGTQPLSQLQQKTSHFPTPQHIGGMSVFRWQHVALAWPRAVNAIEITVVNWTIPGILTVRNWLLQVDAFLLGRRWNHFASYRKILHRFLF